MTRWMISLRSAEASPAVSRQAGPGPSLTGPPGADTNSPGGFPCDCSNAKACSRMLTAAAASISFRCSLARFPPSDSRREAVTVVSRSSTSRTGTWTAGANRTARSRALAAAGPSPPLRLRGNPTRTSIGSYSATMAASLATSSPLAGTVVSGYASRPSGSHAATPIRASPQSNASRTPCRICPRSSFWLDGQLCTAC